MRNIVSFNDNWKFIKMRLTKWKRQREKGEESIALHIPGMRLTDRMAEMIIIVEPAGMLKICKTEKNETDKAYLQVQQ